MRRVLTIEPITAPTKPIAAAETKLSPTGDFTPTINAMMTRPMPKLVPMLVSGGT